MLRALTYGIFNQVVISGTTFLLTTYILWYSTPSEFGLFGLILSLAILTAGAGNALFITQMVVHFPHKIGNEERRYCSNILFLIIAYCALLLLVALAIWILSDIVKWNESRIILSIASLASIVILRDFFVRHAYSMNHQLHALVLNLGIAVILLIFLAIFHWQSDQAKALSVINLWVSSGLLATLIFYFGFYRTNFEHPNVATLVRDMTEAWEGGRFALLSHFVIFLRSQAHVFIVSGMLGLEAFAHLNAVRLFFTPIFVLCPSLVQIYLPKIASALRANAGKGYVLTTKFTIWMFSVALIYVVTLLAFYGYISTILVEKGYVDNLLVVIAWSLFCIMIVVRSGMEILVIAQRKFKFQLKVNMIGAVISLVMAVVLVMLIGKAGAIIGIVVSEIYVIYRMSIKAIEIRDCRFHSRYARVIGSTNYLYLK